MTAGDIEGGRKNVQISEQKHDADAEADADESVVQSREWRPADQRDGDPDQIRVAVQRPALKDVCGLGAEPFQRAPERDWDHERVAVDQAGRT